MSHLVQPQPCLNRPHGGCGRHHCPPALGTGRGHTAATLGPGPDPSLLFRASLGPEWPPE